MDSGERTGPAVMGTSGIAIALKTVRVGLDDVERVRVGCRESVCDVEGVGDHVALLRVAESDNEPLAVPAVDVRVRLLVVVAEKQPWSMNSTDDCSAWAIRRACAASCRICSVWVHVAV